MADTPLFEFVAVTVESAGTRILDRVDLTIPDEGGVTAIVGPSGSGKSTLLRLCNRLEVITDGSLSFRGRSLEDIDPLDLRREVGMVFQRPTVLPGTVRENFAVARADASSAEMEAMLGRVRLPAAMLDRDADRLSGGEAQRVCLARTLLTDPHVLLMDEPTSALDRRASRALEEMARELADGGMPVLWVTHDTDQARRLADRIVLIVDGTIGGDHQREHFLDGEDFDHDHLRARDPGGSSGSRGQGGSGDVDHG